MKKQLFLSTIMIFSLAGCGQSNYIAETTYTLPKVDAKPEIKEATKEFITGQSGYYNFGNPITSTGNEKKFTTGQSGTYTVGQEIIPGLYDLDAVNGTGTVQSDGEFTINEMMGVGNPDYYIEHFDNLLLQEGDVLEVSSVSIKLTPQNGDEDVINPGKYDLQAINGTGTVQGGSINEMMGVGNPDYYIEHYDNATFEVDNYLDVSGVSIKLIPKDKDIVIQEKQEAEPAKDITEKIIVTSDDNTEICYINDVESNCSDLKYTDTLENDISNQMNK